MSFNNEVRKLIEWLKEFNPDYGVEHVSGILWDSFEIEVDLIN